MCVAVKKKLQLYYWKDREFHELQVRSCFQRWWGEIPVHGSSLEVLSNSFSYPTMWMSFFVCQGDFGAPDIPKSMAWCENSICVGFKRDYYLIRVSLTRTDNKQLCVRSTACLCSVTSVSGLFCFSPKQSVECTDTDTKLRLSLNNSSIPKDDTKIQL